MTLIGRSGSLGQTSKHTADIKETELVEPNNVLVSTDRDYAQLASVENTLATQTALNAERYKDQYSALLGFPAGSPAVVTYFHQNKADNTIRSEAADISLTDHAVHKDFTMIKNFEFRLLGALTMQVEEESGAMNITGEGVVYPGFIPRLGDMFFMELADKKICRFKVNNATPLSYQQGSHHKIEFVGLDFLNEHLLGKIMEGVTNTVYFDKRRYLAGDYTFLTHESYVTLQALKVKRKEMLRFYFDQFYRSEYQSLVRPDGVYDPYLVQFLLKKTSLQETRKRPTQLYPRLQNYHLSIWYALLDMEIPSLEELAKSGYILWNTHGVYDTDLTALLNRKFILLGEPPATIKETEPYVFSASFYMAADNMTMFEHLVYSYLFERKLFPEQVLNQISGYRKLTPQLAFYHIPVYVHLVDEALRQLR